MYQADAVQANERVGTIDGGVPIRMILDTGCSKTTVHQRYMDGQKIKTEERKSQVATGDWMTCRLADVTLRVNEKDYPMEVNVTNQLAVPVLLGQDMPLVRRMLYWFDESEKQEEEGRILAVTRAQARKEKLEEEQRIREESEAQGNPSPLHAGSDESPVEEVSLSHTRLSEMRIPTVTAEPREDDCGSDGNDRQEERSESEFDFSEDLFGTNRPARLKLSRGQRRENSRK